MNASLVNAFLPKNGPYALSCAIVRSIVHFFSKIPYRLWPKKKKASYYFYGIWNTWKLSFDLAPEKIIHSKYFEFVDDLSALGIMRATLILILNGLED